MDAEAVADSVQALADVLIDCVEGGASVSFMLPMTREKALRFWLGVAQGVASGDRVLFTATDEDTRILGTVQLGIGQPENQPHRADIAKLLVHRHARRRGVAAALMDAAEQEARLRGKTLLVLDTATGGDAERVYRRAGWHRVGDIPQYALTPDGQPCSTTYYFKEMGPCVEPDRQAYGR
jgi:GNAT superfamily N-acetyltransferase